jgi:hypothetical protein
MGPAQTVGQVFFPLDEELALQPGSLTPRQQEHMTHLAMWMPFARAAQMLEELLGVQVSEPTVRREAERAGCLYEARPTAQGQQPAQATATISREQQVISRDGASVPLVKGAWAARPHSRHRGGDGKGHRTRTARCAEESASLICIDLTHCVSWMRPPTCG